MLIVDYGRMSQLGSGLLIIYQKLVSILLLLRRRLRQCYHLNEPRFYEHMPPIETIVKENRNRPQGRYDYQDKRNANVASKP